MMSSCASLLLRSFFPTSRRALLGLVCVAGISLAVAADPKPGAFQLKDGDRVVFYGDSITEQNLYNTFAETFVLTRFPTMKVSFQQSGWGGDSVRGGGGGPIDRRLDRDVIAYKPTVVTVMLGMNDGRYRAFDQEIFDTYSHGYQHIVEKIKGALPQARIFLIQPSPYDDVTRAPMFDGGYNAVLVRYGDYVKKLAAENQLTAVDLNGPVVASLAQAKALDAALAPKLVPDRVHPDASGHLLMAQALLEAWNAPSLLSSVEIDATAGKLARSENTKVTDLTAAPALSWKQLDGALPFPINLTSPLIALADKAGGVTERFNQEKLRVVGLKMGSYALKIDGAEVGTFTSEELGSGINLGGRPTPMARQAEGVHQLTLKHNRLHYVRLHSADAGLGEITTDAVAKLQTALLKEIDSEEADLVTKQRAAAQPVVHQYEIVAAVTK